jgi:outer membrane protein insertion porin family
MQKQFARTLAALMAAVASTPAFAQQAPLNPAAANTNPTTVCGLPIPPPAALPPAGSGPVLFQIVPCFAKQGGSPVVEAETYLYYMQLVPMVSRPSQGMWTPWDEKAIQTATDDFKRLYATNFLDDLSIEVSDDKPETSIRDYVFANGVIGKIVVYNMEERQRVKIVDYQGSKNIDRTKIAEQLKEKGIELRLDSFLDENLLHRVDGVLKEMMAEKGFSNAVITHKTTEVAGGPKLVNVTFTIGEGPKLRIRSIDFLGNQAFGDGTLARKMKDNKSKKGLIFMTLFRSATYKEDKYEDDAEKVAAYYREKGYVRARVGNPEVKVLEDEKDGKTRWIELRIPVTEGPRYRVGSFDFAGNTVVKSEALRPMFKVKEGEWYSEKFVRDGLKKAQEAYGAGGYMEFTGYPDLNPKNDGLAPVATDGNTPPPAPAPAATNGNATNGDVTDGNATDKNATGLRPTVDVTMRLSEGKQFFVNRIAFVGNSTTRDNVIRREMRLLEGNTFNTEALKYSIRRLNQLG